MNRMCNNCICLNNTCKGSNNTVWTGCIFRKTENNMTKQALLENILDQFLTSKQIKSIQEGWKAFYNEPLKYKNSIVVDMVKLSLESKEV